MKLTSSANIELRDKNSNQLIKWLRVNGKLDKGEGRKKKWSVGIISIVLCLMSQTMRFGFHREWTLKLPDVTRGYRRRIIGGRVLHDTPSRAFHR